MKYLIIVLLVMSFFTYGCSTLFGSNPSAVEEEFDDTDEDEFETLEAEEEEGDIDELYSDSDEEEDDEPLGEVSEDDEPLVQTPVKSADFSDAVAPEEDQGGFANLVRDCNVRSSPTKGATVLNTIKDRRRLWVEPAEKDKWYKVYLKKVVGYMHGICFGM